VHNNFTFEGNTLNDLSAIDAFIPLKNEHLVEMIMSAMLWAVVEKKSYLFSCRCCF
jgi:hypothetical protein